MNNCLSTWKKTAALWAHLLVFYDGNTRRCDAMMEEISCSILDKITHKWIIAQRYDHVICWLWGRWMDPIPPYAINSSSILRNFTATQRTRLTGTLFKYFIHAIHAQKLGMEGRKSSEDMSVFFIVSCWIPSFLLSFPGLTWRKCVEFSLLGNFLSRRFINQITGNFFVIRIGYRLGMSRSKQVW